MTTLETMDPKGLAANLKNPRWRLDNLYHIINRAGQDEPFHPNPIQTHILDNMWFRNIVFKTRKRGTCLVPSTYVLTADLRWVRIDSLEPGDSLVAVDEDTNGRWRSRKMRTAVVEATKSMTADAYRIDFDDGRSVICTGTHRWLSKKTNTQTEWRSVECNTKKKLRVGTKVRWITKPWNDAEIRGRKELFRDAWFGGILDGEGSMTKASRVGVSVKVTQRPGAVLESIKSYCASNGYTYRIEEYHRIKLGKPSFIPNVVVGKMDEIFRLIGTTRPVRFITRRWWEGKDLPGKSSHGVGWATITAITPVGEQRVIDLQTSTGTFIAEGFVSHNSTLIGLLALDKAMWSPNQNCQMINDSMDHAEELFSRVILYAYDHLPETIKAIMPLASQTQRKLAFNNVSVIHVGTSSVGTTPTFLHVSELGKISYDTPMRARDILTGSIQAVASDGGQMVWIESTAWGKTGLFKEMVDLAKKKRDLGQRLSKLDMQLMFYPWYLGADNRIFDSDQVISAEMEEYFAKIPVPLDRAQKQWYCTQFEALGPDMFIQHPSNEDEPFSVSIEGAYFSQQFKRIYAEKRIGNIPIVPEELVHTSWDIGMHDYTAIWFWQIVDGWAHAIDYYECNDIGLQHYVEILEARGYRYGTHYAPHDINVKEIGSGKTRLEQALEMGLRFKIVPRIGKKMDAIELARKLLNCVKFDEERCNRIKMDDPKVKGGITHLEEYRKKWNPLTNGWSDEPAKTGDQHAADALMTFAQGYQGQFKRTHTILEGGESEWTKGRW